VLGCLMSKEFYFYLFIVLAALVFELLARHVLLPLEPLYQPPAPPFFVMGF
jgi:hypothetical protein